MLRFDIRWGMAMALMVLAMAADARGQVLSQERGTVRSSLLLLIDASGSRGDAIGGGNPEVKIEAAKRAAADALSRAVGGGSVEVAVLAFSGDCQNPVPRYQDFTRDIDRLTRFIDSLQPGGGTPMADALLFANRYLAANGSAGASDRMIMLLADGQNDCGDIDNALATLQASGVIFRHETVGFGITPNSGAAQDLRQIATQTGGAYHHAAAATQLTDVFMEFVDTLTVIDMLGAFGQRPQATPNGTAGAASAPTQASASQASRKPAGNAGLSSMIGGIRARTAVGGGTTAESGTRQAQEVYVAAATTLGPGSVPNQSWRYATGWSEGSGHDAGIEAENACRRSSGSTCWAAGSSMRGGCVALVEGVWLDADEPDQRLEVFVGTNQSRSWAEQITLDQCRAVIHSGKPAETVEAYECNLKVSFCSADVRP